VAVRCLIVDDNEAFLASAKRLLDEQGLDVVGAASSAGEALRLAGELSPDVVLADVELGGESGFHLARRLTSAQPRVRVILISMYSEDEIADLIAESPAAGFLAKSQLSAAAILLLLGD
jgi:DNA-binding NarL/FixJ family response regulator